MANVTTTGTFTIPKVFVLEPSQLLPGNALPMLMAALTATITAMCLAGSLHGISRFGPARWWDRLLRRAPALTPIKPGFMTDRFGLALIGLTVARQRWLRPAASPRLDAGFPCHGRTR